MRELNIKCKINYFQLFPLFEILIHPRNHYNTWLFKVGYYYVEIKWQ